MILVLPLGLSFMIAMVYLGAWPRDVEGGSPPTQLLGLTLSIVGFVAVWYGLHRGLAGLGPAVGALLLPTALSIVLYPLIANLALRVFGVRVVKKARHG